MEKRDKKLTAMERKQELLQLMKDLGPWNMNGRILGQKYGVSRQQINRDVHDLLKGLKSTDLSTLGKIFELSYQKSMKECQMLMNDPDKEIRIKAIRAGMDTNQKYVDFLENWGLKDKIPERVDNRLTWQDFGKAYKKIQGGETDGKKNKKSGKEEKKRSAKGSRKRPKIAKHSSA